jgi:hypothetical protein
MAGGANMTAAQPIKTIRYVITTTDGKKSEAYVPADTGAPDQRGWRPVAIPLRAISGFDRTNKVVKSIAVSADSLATFYVGDIRIVNDATPVRARMLFDSNGTGWRDATKLNIGLGTELSFGAVGEGGASVLKYSWDFDSSDGIETDAEGSVVKRKFRKDGTFKITLTVTDVYGLKAPFTTTIDIVVNP